MERATHAAHRWRLPVLIAVGIAGAVLLRDVLWALAGQLAAAALLMLLALPLCRVLERRIPPSPAAAVSLLMLGALAVLALMMLFPPLLRQMQQLAADVPAMLAWADARWTGIVGWLQERGIDITAVREELFNSATDWVKQAVSGMVGTVSRLMGSLSRVLLAPLLAFYLLRDRKRIATGLTLLLPVKHRARGVRAAREMRRETAAYLRGQLMLSLAVGGLTALGLLLTGTPGWLLLGLLMGVMELVPYVGPVIAGIPAVLLALQNGWISASWTLAVLAAVQQLEGAVLSPRLLAGATQLHPMAVLLLVSAGGMVGGALGMLLVIPLVVSLRGALRGFRD